MALSQNDKAIIEAYRIGYRADEEGNLYNPEGERLDPYFSNYARFTVRGVKGSPLVHRFIAYCWFGEEVFGKIVRHLDDNPKNNRKQNLAVGTARDNYYDMPDEVKLRKARGTSKNLRKHDPLEIANLLEEGYTHRQIKALTGASIGVISRVRNGRR